MEHSVGDAIIVAALAALFGAYLYFKHAERKRRLEVIHQERLVAMEKGIPLPELPIDPPSSSKGPDPGEPLLHGIVWAAFGGGGMLALWLIGAQVDGVAVWPLALPLLLLGAGLILYYVLTSERAR